MSALLVCAAAVSPLGRGDAAASVGPPGQRPVTCVRFDSVLAAADVRIPYVARADLPPDPADRAEALLALCCDDLNGQLRERAITLQPSRTRVFLGTSSGGFDSLMRACSSLERGESLERELAERVPYFGPLRALGGLGFDADATVQVMAACASSTFALGLGLRAIELGEADWVIAGGYDAVTPLVAAGFCALGATSQVPRPFRRDRAGLALGEAAVLMLLARDGLTESARARLAAFAASTDAHHATAPDPSGRWLRGAAGRALELAHCGHVELLSAHGTATSFNDRAEASALSELSGVDEHTTLHAFKGVVGHTLGAAGALESLAAVDAMERGILPASAGEGPLLEGLVPRVLNENEAGSAANCLKLAAAFGGANAALVWQQRSAASVERERTAAAVYLRAVGPQVKSAVLASHPRLVIEKTKLDRFDELSRLVLRAVLEALPPGLVLPPERTAVVVGTATATLEIDLDFERRRRKRGAEPRRFPATSPNLAPGNVCQALGWHGPSLAVGASGAAALEALWVGSLLVAGGDADAVVVVACEHVGELCAAVWSAAGWPLPEAGAAACVLTREPVGSSLPPDRARRAWTAACAEQGRVAGAAPGSAALLAALAGIGAR